MQKTGTRTIVEIAVLTALSATTVVSTGCNNGSATGQQAGASIAAQEGMGGAAVSPSPQAPFVAHWQLVAGENEPGATLRLRLLIERRGSWPLPIEIAVAVPGGATLLAGEQSRTLATDTEPGTTVLDYAIRIGAAALPAEDLVAVVHSAGRAAGAHAEPHYRFGRPEPAVLGANRKNPPIRIGLTKPGFTVERSAKPAVLPSQSSPSATQLP
ncbi:MAG: hypothetical protein V2A73_21205 [Pseudomonadota bacterium]